MNGKLETISATPISTIQKPSKYGLRVGVRIGENQWLSFFTKTQDEANDFENYIKSEIEHKTMLDFIVEKSGDGRTNPVIKSYTIHKGAIPTEIVAEPQKTVENIPYMEALPSYESRAEERITISWSINCALQYAQINKDEVWNWDNILKEAEVLRRKAGFE